ncbi:putative nuclease HARBI1 [Lineus longissimus]|uniref:putative nuclease HARBI1 n=1 Tax=Lineus longissimus TaxID=88925 RepID=UPI00315DEF5D
MAEWLDMLDIMEVLEENNPIMPVPRLIRDRKNPFQEYRDEEFRIRYRFRKDSVLHFLDLITADIEHPTDKNSAIPAYLQLLVPLRFFATGKFHREDGDLVGVHQSSVSRIVNRVSRAIARRRPEFIAFPDADAARDVRRRFYEVAGFPGVIGLIDGIHVPISCPSIEDAEIFRNRKRIYSINVQGISGPDMEFTNIVARWPGSTHDSRIFENSAVCMKYENGQIGNGLLLGDRGYPCRRYLLTPFHNPVDAASIRYNDAHIATRSAVERVFGIWKRRFPCLKMGLRVKLKKFGDNNSHSSSSQLRKETTGGAIRW